MKLPKINKSESAPEIRQKRTTGFVVLNPVAGKGNPDETKAILQSSLGREQYDLYETTGKESLEEVVQTAVQKNKYAWVAAIGGDGTVSQVANGLMGTETPLVILPGGTGNVLAQELNIPQDIEAACELLKGSGEFQPIDVIQVNDNYFVHQLGIGLESATMQSTSSAQKNRWGLAAYLWTAVKEAFGWQPYHITLTVDGEKHPIYHASELSIANAAKIGAFGLEWDGTIAPDDGRLDIIILRANSLIDYAQIAWAMITGQQRQSRQFQIFSATKDVRVETEQPLPVHGDGEVYTDILPFTAVLLPHALQVLVPQPQKEDSQAH